MKLLTLPLKTGQPLRDTTATLRSQLLPAGDVSVTLISLTRYCGLEYALRQPSRLRAVALSRASSSSRLSRKAAVD